MTIAKDFVGTSQRGHVVPAPQLSWERLGEMPPIEHVGEPRH